MKNSINVFFIVIFLSYLCITTYEYFGGRYQTIRQETVMHVGRYPSGSLVLVTFDGCGYARYRLSEDHNFKSGDIVNVKVWRGNITGFDYSSEL